MILVHYGDLQADLEGQMRLLADRLGIEVPEERWAELVPAATFDQMRQRSDELAPGLGIWHDNQRFFHRGTSGQWRSLLGADDLGRYQARVAEWADPELSAWAHHGPILA